jgi:hypothetical protein
MRILSIKKMVKMMQQRTTNTLTLTSLKMMYKGKSEEGIFDFIVVKTISRCTP